MPTLEDLGDNEEVPEQPENPGDPPLMFLRKPAPPSILNPETDLDEEEDDDDLDETLAERLWGLTEMFPETFRNVSSTAVVFSWEGTKFLYHIGRMGMWVAASAATILALPIMFETERAQMEEQQIQQQRQILLGPNAAMSGANPGLMSGAMPQVMPPQAPPR